MLESRLMALSRADFALYDSLWVSAGHFGVLPGNAPVATLLLFAVPLAIVFAVIASWFPSARTP